jgi:hypothetical protein
MNSHRTTSGLSDPGTIVVRPRSEEQPIMTDTPQRFDREESMRLRERMKVYDKECYHNARRAIMRLKGYESATYVEGFAATVLGFPVEHGWIVREGLIIDPTLPDLVEKYFPGIEVQGREGLKAFYTLHGRKYSRTPLFYAFGWGGADHPGFHKARVESDQQARWRKQSNRSG